MWKKSIPKLLTLSKNGYKYFEIKNQNPVKKILPEIVPKAVDSIAAIAVLAILLFQIQIFVAAQHWKK